MDINKRIDCIDKLDADLNELNSIIDKISKVDYDELMNNISPIDRVDLNWNIAFSQYSLYFIWLKVNNKDPTQHKVKDEMTRIRDFYEKIQCTKNKSVNIVQA